MSKSRKITILMILAIISAIVTGTLIFKYCNSTKGFIYVFNDDYKAGTRIEKSMLSPMKVDDQIIKTGQKGSLETYYITGENYAKVIERNEYLLNDVSKNQPLTLVDLAMTSGSSIERSLSGNGMAVTIPISGTAAVTDELRVGSVVNIYSSDASGTKLLFENMRIIARNDDKSVSKVTFETSPDDTLDLINAANNKKLYFSLVSPVLDENAHSGYVVNEEGEKEESIIINNTDPDYTEDVPVPEDNAPGDSSTKQ